jgi:hypothetical protein
MNTPDSSACTARRNVDSIAIREVGPAHVLFPGPASALLLRQESSYPIGARRVVSRKHAQEARATLEWRALGYAPFRGWPRPLTQEFCLPRKANDSARRVPRR